MTRLFRLIGPVSAGFSALLVVGCSKDQDKVMHQGVGTTGNYQEGSGSPSIGGPRPGINGAGPNDAGPTTDTARNATSRPT